LRGVSEETLNFHLRFSVSVIVGGEAPIYY
jgi:hypothetical protein